MMYPDFQSITKRKLNILMQCEFTFNIKQVYLLNDNNFRFNPVCSNRSIGTKHVGGRSNSCRHAKNHGRPIINLLPGKIIFDKIEVKLARIIITSLSHKVGDIQGARGSGENIQRDDNRERKGNGK